jgi:hypothetical protein
MKSRDAQPDPTSYTAAPTLAARKGSFLLWSAAPAAPAGSETRQRSRCGVAGFKARALKRGEAWAVRVWREGEGAARG